MKKIIIYLLVLLNFTISFSKETQSLEKEKYLKLAADAGNRDAWDNLAKLYYRQNKHDLVKKYLK